MIWSRYALLLLAFSAFNLAVSNAYHNDKAEPTQLYDVPGSSDILSHVRQFVNLPTWISLRNASKSFKRVINLAPEDDVPGSFFVDLMTRLGKEPQTSDRDPVIKKATEDLFVEAAGEMGNIYRLRFLKNIIQDSEAHNRALSHALEENNIFAVKELLKAGRYLNAENHVDVKDIMFSAVNHRQPDLLRVAVESAAQKLTDEDLNSLLKLACELDFADIVSFLLNNKWIVNYPTNIVNKWFEYAVVSVLPSTVKTFIDSGKVSKEVILEQLFEDLSNSGEIRDLLKAAYRTTDTSTPNSAA